MIIENYQDAITMVIGVQGCLNALAVANMNAETSSTLSHGEIDNACTGLSTVVEAVGHYLDKHEILLEHVEEHPETATNTKGV